MAVPDVQLKPEAEAIDPILVIGVVLLAAIMSTGLVFAVLISAFGA